MSITLWTIAKIAAALAAGAAIVVLLSAFLSECAQRVAQWLREAGLERSILMDATVMLEKVGNRARKLIRTVVKAPPRSGFMKFLLGEAAPRVTTISEEVIELSQIPQELKADLDRDCSTSSLMAHLN